MTLKDKQDVEKLRSGNLVYRNKKFTAVELGCQILTVKVHWLPYYLHDNVAKAFLCDYGRIISIEMLTSVVGGLRVYNEMREVKIQVDKSHNFPYHTLCILMTGRRRC